MATKMKLNAVRVDKKGRKIFKLEHYVGGGAPRDGLKIDNQEPDLEDVPLEGEDETAEKQADDNGPVEAARRRAIGESAKRIFGKVRNEDRATETASSSPAPCGSA